MYLLGHHATPDDRHVYLTWLSAAGPALAPALDPERRRAGEKDVVEAVPTPASVSAGLASDHLLDAGVVRVGRSLVTSVDVTGREGTCVGGWLDQASVDRNDAFVLFFPPEGGHVPAVMLHALTFEGPLDWTGRRVLPVCVPAAGAAADALASEITRACPGATVEEPLMLSGSTPQELAAPLLRRLDELVL